MKKNLMTYKGYIGSIEYSEEDGVFIGRLEGISDLIMFEGKSVKELEKDFREAVDDYLEGCRKKGREPQRPAKGNFNVRIGAELHLKALIKASKKGLSLNSLVKRAIEKEISHAK